LLVSLSASLVALSVLVGCGPSNEYAANPAPYEAPAAELARASSAEFKPLITALLSLRAATKAMNDYRLAQPRVLDEAQQKKYEELRAVSAMLAAEVAKRVQAAQFSTEQLATWEVISALPPNELQKLAQ
jgi:small-conductance mechanosensitive channel